MSSRFGIDDLPPIIGLARTKVLRLRRAFYANREPHAIRRNIKLTHARPPGWLASRRVAFYTGLERFQRDGLRRRGPR